MTASSLQNSYWERDLEMFGMASEILGIPQKWIEGMLSSRTFGTNTCKMEILMSVVMILKMLAGIKALVWS